MREHFVVLATRGVLEPDVANTLAASVKVRNLIGHAYAAVDPAKLLEAGGELLGVLERFCASVLEFAEARRTQP